MAAVTSHDAIEELLSAYIDGELRPGELDLVVEHLADCEGCILLFHRLQEVKRAVRLLPELSVPAGVLPDAHLGSALSAYLDGELPTAEVPEAVSHLAGCTSCRNELHDLDAARTAVRSLPRLEPPEFLEPSRTPVASRSRRRRRAATWAAGIAAAAVVAVAVSGNGAPTHHVDLDSFADRHLVRASIEPGFSMVPAVAPVGEP